MRTTCDVTRRSRWCGSASCRRKPRNNLTVHDVVGPAQIHHPRMHSRPSLPSSPLPFSIHNTKRVLNLLCTTIFTGEIHSAEVVYICSAAQSRARPNAFHDPGNPKPFADGRRHRDRRTRRRTSPAKRCSISPHRTCGGGARTQFCFPGRDGLLTCFVSFVLCSNSVEYLLEQNMRIRPYESPSSRVVVTGINIRWSSHDTTLLRTSALQFVVIFSLYSKETFTKRI
jgi:hypothetical protein